MDSAGIGIGSSPKCVAPRDLMSGFGSIANFKDLVTDRQA
jgi:hypothetical protein